MPYHLDTPLGCFIRKQLHRLRLSQGAAAEQLGISRQGLGKILSGKTSMPDIDLLVKLATVLEVSEAAIFRATLEGLNNAPTLIPVVEQFPQHDKTSFVRDVTVPDMTLVLAGSSFTKTWAIQNSGTQHWVNRRLKCMDNEFVIARREPSGELSEQVSLSLRPKAREILVPETAPGSIATLSVDFVAPSHPCITLSTWKMVDESRDLCFPDLAGLWCLVKVYEL